jgi:putative FmdB family regulatory protein
MPIYEIVCQECGKTAETLVFNTQDPLVCPACGSERITKLMSAPSDYGNQTATRFPGPKDTACCGNSPAEAGCAGPGSCCGKQF